MFSTGFTSLGVLLLLYRLPSLSLCMVFNSTSSNLDEIPWINPFANVFVFGDFNVHHKDWPAYPGGTDRPGELCYNFLSQMILLRWLTFLLESLTDSQSPALLELFLSSDASVCSTMAFPPLGNSNHVVASVSIDFPPFHRIACDYSRADWDGLFDHLRHVPWEKIFKLSASAAAS